MAPRTSTPPPGGRADQGSRWKVHVIAYGCQMSAADSEEMARPLADRGFEPSGLAEADVALVNTCTVRQHAEDRAISLLGRLRAWKDSRPGRFLIVAGCAAERLGDSLRRRFPHVDLVVGARSIERTPALLEEALAGRFDWARENAGAWAPHARTLGTGRGSMRASPVSAYVTIMRGCNYSCAYCIVPSVRGREIYRPLEIILAETRERAAAGAREIVLLGQTVNSWRRAGEGDFADLLRAVGSSPGIRRVRFMSPHPRYLDSRLAEAMAEGPGACPHIHLPLQSGSDAVLRRMRRGYTAAQYFRRVDRLRRAAPGMAVSTDVIAGFPGETEADFALTLGALRELGPVSAYCFKFSPRPGTEAAGLPDQVPEPAIEERLSRLLALTDELSRNRLAQEVGRRVEVLLEDARDGRTAHGIRARLEASARPGELVAGVVTAAAPNGLKVRSV